MRETCKKSISILIEISKKLTSILISERGRPTLEVHQRYEKVRSMKRAVADLGFEFGEGKKFACEKGC